MAITDLDLDVSFQKIEISRNTDTDNFSYNNLKNLKVLYLNARSIRTGDKLAQIESFLKDINCTVHVIVITETWVKENEKQFFNISNYTSTFSCRKDRTGGGVGIFVLNGLNFKICKEYSDNIMNFITIELLFQNNFIKITGFYRTPPISNNFYSRFLTKFQNVLENNFNNTESMIFGDFNVDLAQMDSEIYHDYVNLIHSYSYFICDSQTVTRPASQSILDHIISNNFFLES